MANIGVRAFEQVGAAITEAFAKGELRALNFGNVIRGVMSSIVQSILRLGVVNPIINSIFSGTMLPTLGAGLSILGGGGAAAAAGGGGGGIAVAIAGAVAATATCRVIIRLFIVAISPLQCLALKVHIDQVHQCSRKR